MKNPNTYCKLCKYTSKEFPYIEENDIRFYKCMKCGLLQRRYIEIDDIFLSGNSILPVGLENYRKEQLQSVINEKKLKTEKILEIGCGSGVNLEILTKGYPWAYGLEYSTEHMDVYLEKEVNVHVGYINYFGYKIPLAPYHAFFMFDFLQKIYNPISFFDGLFNNLTEDAIGIIEYTIPQKLPKNALYIFSESTFKMMIETNGLDIINFSKLTTFGERYSATVRKKSLPTLNNVLK